MSGFAMLDNWSSDRQIRARRMTKMLENSSTGVCSFGEHGEIVCIATCCKCGNEFEVNVFDSNVYCGCGHISNLAIVRWEV